MDNTTYLDELVAWQQAANLYVHNEVLRVTGVSTQSGNNTPTLPPPPRPR